MIKSDDKFSTLSTRILVFSLALIGMTPPSKQRLAAKTSDNLNPIFIQFSYFYLV